MNYSDKVAEWLVELGYTDCFFVGGGNIMHLIESISRVIRCHAVIHEVAAGIAAEYFNESSTSAKAFALVTAGPGLTNIVTALAGAFLESRIANSRRVHIEGAGHLSPIEKPEEVTVAIRRFIDSL